MSRIVRLPSRLLAAVLILLSSATWAVSAHASPLLVNGDFEMVTDEGLPVGWTVFDPDDLIGTWFLLLDIPTPISGYVIPPPPSGLFAMVTDQDGPGSHALYQDFVVPTSISKALLQFEVFIGNRADAFFTNPTTLDYLVPPNQQARVDILRLRFTEVDTEFYFQVGVDRVHLDVTQVPEPTSLVLLASGLLTYLFQSGRRGVNREKATRSMQERPCRRNMRSCLWHSP
jgi:hypothetical protein